MVRPDIPEEERNVASRRLKVGFVLLVAASAVLLAVPLDPSAGQLVAAFVGGALFGAGLLWYVLRNLQEYYRRI